MIGVNGPPKVGDDGKPWPTNEEAQLRKLWDEGYSAGMIGQIMGKSRNSIIGKKDRMELPPRRSLAVLPNVRNGTGGKRQTNFNFSLGKAPKERSKAVLPPTHVVPTEIGIPLNGTGITILEISRDQCHAVIREHNRRTSELARYCGLPVAEDGESYCAGHYAAFHRLLHERR